MKWLIICLIFVFLVGGVSADVYYVRPVSYGSGNGQSYENAWSWSQFLDVVNWGAEVDKVSPGDTVYLSGQFNIGSTPGTIPGSGSQSGGYVVIDGDDGVHTPATINMTSMGSGGIYINGKSYIEIIDINFIGSSQEYDGAALKTAGGASYFKIHNCNVNGSFARGFFIRYSNNYDIYDNELTSTNTIGQSDGIKNTASHDGYVYRNHLYDWDHTAIECLNDKEDYEDGDTYNIYIYDNNFELINRGYGRAFDVSSWDLSGNTRNIYVFNNTIKNMRVRSHASQGADYVYIYNNLFYNTINLCVDGTETGCSEAGIDSDVPSTYYKSGQHIDISTIYGSVSNIFIFNNTFYQSAETALWINNQVNVDNLHFKNNIIYDSANTCQPTDSPPGSESTRYDYSIGFWNPDFFTNSEIKNNLIYSPTRHSAGDIRYDAEDYLLCTVGEFNTLYSWASENIEADPQLTDPENGNFAPLAGSPACTASETGSYVGAIPCSSGIQICIHEAEIEPCDGKVSRGELDDYVDLWKSNSGIILSQVIEAIGIWKNMN